MPKDLYQNNRLLDTQTTKQVEIFLDNYYTGKIPFTRVTTKSLQYQGVDVIFGSESGEEMLVDEKCATDYIGKDLQTFSFELRSSSDKKSGYRYDGWLISDKIITTHYLICYIDKATVPKHPTVEQIQVMEVMLVNKNKIIDYLVSHGWNRKALREKCDSIDAGDTDFGRIEKGYKFAKSRHKIEAPINILIPRAELRLMAVHNDIIRNL